MKIHRKSSVTAFSLTTKVDGEDKKMSPCTSSCLIQVSRHPERVDSKRGFPTLHQYEAEEIMIDFRVNFSCKCKQDVLYVHSYLLHTTHFTFLL